MSLGEKEKENKMCLSFGEPKGNIIERISGEVKDHNERLNEEVTPRPPGN